MKNAKSKSKIKKWLEKKEKEKEKKENEKKENEKEKKENEKEKKEKEKKERATIGSLQILYDSGSSFVERGKRNMKDGSVIFILIQKCA